MDVAISSYAAEPAQRLGTRLQVGLGAQADALRSGLFEQILSLPVPLDLDHWQPEQPPPPADEEVQSQAADDAVATGAEADETQAVPSDEEPEDSPAEANQAVIVVDASLPAVDTSLPAEKSLEPESELSPVQTELTAVERNPADVDPSQPPVEIDANETPKVAVATSTATDAAQAADSETIDLGAPSPAESSEHQSEHARQQSEQSSEVNLQPEAEPVQSVADDEPQAADANAGIDQATSSQQSKTVADVAGDQDSNGKRGNRREKWYAHAPSQAVSAEHNADGASQPNTRLPQNVDEAASTQAATATAGGSDPRPPTTPVNTTVAANVVVPAITNPTVDSPSKTFSASPATAASQELSSTGAERGVNSSSASATDAKSSISGKKDTAPQRAADLSQQERVRLVQRISRSFARLGPAGGQVNIRLHPPQLGSLNVQVRLEGRSMTAKLSTETAAARDAILESLPVLRGRLAEQGFEISQFQVEVADNNADAATGGNQQQSLFDQSGGGGQSRTQVDYRRFAGNQRPAVDVAPELGQSTNVLAWDASAGIDIKA